MTLLGHVTGAPPVGGTVGLVGGVLLAAAWLDRSGREAGVLPSRRRAALWLAALAGLAVTVGPMEAAAHERFAVHMVQHLVLLLVVAPALVVARPDLVVLRRLSGRTRRHVAQGSRVAAPAWPLAPALAALGLAGWLWVAHLPGVYDAQLQSAWLHGVEHAVWVTVGTAFWAPLLRRRSSATRRILTAVLQVVILLPASSILSLVLLSGPEPRFAHHRDLGAAVLTDQRLGTGVMWAGLAVVLLGWVLVVIGTSDRTASSRRPQGTRAG